MVDEENLNEIKKLISLLENEIDQEKINAIGDRYKPIAQFYVNESKVVKNGKAVYTFSLSDTQNYFQHWNFGEALIHNKEELYNNLKILRMHILSKIENNSNQLIKKNERSINATYNIYGNNNIVNNGSIYSDAINKINDMLLSKEDKDEIINHVELIQMIIESNDSKDKKWSKLKNIGKWIFDKSVDIGIALLPLLLNIH